MSLLQVRSEFSLARWERAKEAIALARTVDEVKDIRDKAEAMRLYARQAGESLEVQNQIAEIKIRAERKAGELLAEMEKQQGARGVGSNQHRKVESRDATPPPRLSDVGISKSQSSRWQQIARLPESEFEAHVAETTAAGRELTTAGTIALAKTKEKIEAKRERAEQLRAEPLPAPAGPFRVIVADPPWQYDKRAEDVTHRALCPYPDMSIDEICALPVASLAEDNCILWLWTTNAHMREAFRCLDAWGFEHKTILTWAKNKMGTGDWLRGKTEHCLMAIRGRPLVTLANQTTLLEAPVREHSRKPDEFYLLVEAFQSITETPTARQAFGARIRNKRWALGIEQPELAELARCLPHQVQDAEVGRCYVPGVLERIAKVLGIEGGKET